MAREADPDLRRFERDAVIACLAMTALALALSRGVAAPLGVVAGGLLMALSYRAVKGGVDAIVGLGRGSREGSPGPGAAPGEAARETNEGAALAPAAGAAAGRRRMLVAVKFVTRYALLAVGAYAMLTCFRLHPLGLLAGAASPFVAAAVHVVRMSRASV